MKYDINEILAGEFGEVSPSTMRDYGTVIDLYNDFIHSRLARGLDVEIEGVGVLHPYVRQVKNSFGREYSIKVELKQNPGFRDTLVKNYEKNHDIFRRKK